MKKKTKPCWCGKLNGKRAMSNIGCPKHEPKYGQLSKKK